MYIYTILNYLSSLSKLSKIILIIVSILLINASVLWGYFSNTQDPYTFNDDSRILYPYFTFSDPELFQNDRMTEVFWSQFYQPIGFYALNYVWAHMADPYILIKNSPLLLWPIAVIAIGFISWKLGGALNCWCTTLIAVNYNYFMSRIIGGLAHSYAIPLMCLCIMSMVYKKFFWLAFFIILSSCFYPPISVIMGLVMAYVLLIADDKYHGDLQCKSKLFKWVFVAFTGCTSVFIILYGFMLMLQVDYGAAIDSTNIHHFPELGPKGRIGDFTNNPWEFVARKILFQFNLSFVVFALMMMAFSLFILVKWVCSKELEEHHFYMKAIILINVMLAFFCALFKYNDYTYLFIKLTIPLYFVLLLPLSFGHYLARNQKTSLNDRSILLVGIFIFIALMLAHNNKGNTGYNIAVFPRGVITYDFISTLPKDTLFAGLLRKHDSFIETVPFLSKRRALALYELHYVPYDKMTLDIRDSIKTTIDIYHATSFEPFVKLHNKWKVDYFIFEPYWLGREDYAYMEPFETYYKEKLIVSAGKDLILPRLTKKYSIHKNGEDLYILDLNALIHDIKNNTVLLN